MTNTLVQSVHRPVRISVSLWSFISVPKKRSAISVAALLVVLSFVYIIQTNAVATRGYEITSLAHELKEAQSVKSGLELQIAELRTTSAIEQRVQELKLVGVGHIDYVQPVSTAVALK